MMVNMNTTQTTLIEDTIYEDFSGRGEAEVHVLVYRHVESATGHCTYVVSSSDPAFSQEDLSLEELEMFADRDGYYAPVAAEREFQKENPCTCCD